MFVLSKPSNGVNLYTLFDGFADDKQEFYASVVFFPAPKGVRRLREISESIMCKTVE